VLAWNATDKEVLDSALSYNPANRTIVIVHGYTDSYDEMNWNGDMKDFILNIQNQVGGQIHGWCHKNVIGVDWRAGAQKPLYFQAVANTPIVGAIIAQFIQRLIRLYPEANNTPNNFTIVGQSLGAHVAGFVGKNLTGGGVKLRNIIGLDPAGPAFTEIPNSHRLGPSDASMVVVIHTDGGDAANSFGFSAPLGHYDFYPNGGSQQPGCEKQRSITNVLLDGLFPGLMDMIACNHRRATQFVQTNESLYTTAQSMAYACSR